MCREMMAFDTLLCLKLINRKNMGILFLFEAHQLAIKVGNVDKYYFIYCDKKRKNK